MSVTDVQKDASNLTMTIIAEFHAGMTQVWNLFEDPRKLERWWGPLAYPATFIAHDLSPGGRMSYFMTGTDGDLARGWWRILELEAPQRLVFENGIAGDDGNPDPSMPFMLMEILLSERSDGVTRLTVKTLFPSVAAMKQFISMGMEEGLTQAISQIDALL